MSDVAKSQREEPRPHTRDRVVRVAEWAWPYLQQHLASLTPGERLVRGLNRWQVGDAHRARLTALGLPHHRVHDSRHFYAIRAIRAGTPYELVARQLGHADIAMVAKVYGRLTALRRAGPLRANRRGTGPNIRCEIDHDGYRCGYRFRGA
jgi:integrase